LVLLVRRLLLGRRRLGRRLLLRRHLGGQVLLRLLLS